MKRLSIALLVYFFCLCACTKQVQVIEVQPGNCHKYTELNYLNYDSLKTDAINLLDVKMEDNCLQLTLQYDGGCKDHKVDLALILPEKVTLPLLSPTFEIRHNSNNDVCKALITNNYSFDISGIKEAGKHSTNFILAYKKTSGTIISSSYTYKY
ncbi:MAG TPA: hypothetical protein DCL77_15755 [Prolixibacteraceae bacterium]|jgi:hypothetical protein|nr:hypothetical protein [Prolixibacteraceae bacterium]